MKRTCFILLLTVFASTSLWAQTRKKATLKKASTSVSASIAAGQKVYTLYCLSCHQADGGGVQNMNPPLIKTPYVLGDKTRLIKIILNGFNESVDINGDTYTNIMPPLNILNDADIANVLTYVRRNFTNKASAVTVAEVKRVRAAAAK